MDPSQGLCLGALFDIAATNGLDMGRRLCIFGICHSIEMPSDVIEDTVVEHGGEVVAAEKVSSGGLQKKLVMTIAVPLLWGVPPASGTLCVAVRSGVGRYCRKDISAVELFVNYKQCIASISKLQEMLCTNDSKSVSVSYPHCIYNLLFLVFIRGDFKPLK
ncbi:unnamed protein product [Musa acuminata subsp. burmannicoides]